MYRLTNEPGGLGLSCTPAGLSLAGVPLLEKTGAGFAPRPAPEIASLIQAAFGADGDPTRLEVEPRRHRASPQRRRLGARRDCRSADADAGTEPGSGGAARED